MLHARCQCLASQRSACSNLLAPDRDAALAMADLRPGELVAVINCGVGDLLPLAKEQVGPTGTVVGTDKASDLVWRASRATLQAHGLVCATPRCFPRTLTRMPQGLPAEQVFLAHIDPTVAHLEQSIFHQTKLARRKFDCIFLLHAWPEVAPLRRQPLLAALQRMLSPQGRIVLTLDLCALNPAAHLVSSKDTGVPAQYRSASVLTGVPGCVVVQQTVDERQVVTHVEQLAPQGLYDQAYTQAKTAAKLAGLRAVRHASIGHERGFGSLEKTSIAPLPDVLDQMDLAQLQAWCDNRPPRQGVWHHAALVQRRLQLVYGTTWATASPRQQTHCIATSLEHQVQSLLLAPSSVLPKAAQVHCLNVGVLVRLEVDGGTRKRKRPA